MKIDILDNLHYQSFPLSDNAKDFNEEDLSLIGVTKQFDVNNKTIIDYDNSQQLANNIKEERVADIKVALKSLSEDAIQIMMGEVVPNWEEKKEKFVSLHNELRVIEGKTPREIANKIV